MQYLQVRTLFRHLFQHATQVIERHLRGELEVNALQDLHLVIQQLQALDLEQLLVTSKQWCLQDVVHNAHHAQEFHALAGRLRRQKEAGCCELVPLPRVNTAVKHAMEEDARRERDIAAQTETPRQDVDEGDRRVAPVLLFLWFAVKVPAFENQWAVGSVQLQLRRARRR